MSKDTEQNIAGMLRKYAWTFLAASFALGGWVTTLEIRARAFDSTSDTVGELDRWRSVHEARAWDRDDASKHEQRIQKLENNNEHIIKALDRIEKQLGTK